MTFLGGIILKFVIVQSTLSAYVLLLRPCAKGFKRLVFWQWVSAAICAFSPTLALTKHLTKLATIQMSLMILYMRFLVQGIQLNHKIDIYQPIFGNSVLTNGCTL
tara:strand:- start:1045 stop:1359 length:315 start_codon:yes stop_codon:yes gene_type:complete